MDAQEYDTILRHLVQIAAHQDAINTDLRAGNADLRAFTRQQVALNQRQAAMFSLLGVLIVVVVLVWLLRFL
jgi:hypothetical protein